MLLDGLINVFPNLLEAEDAPAGTAAESPWLPSWLPIAHNLGGGNLFLDLREGPEYGCVGKQYRDEAWDGNPMWLSVTGMLADIAEGLATGAGVDLGFARYRAKVEDGRMCWESAKRL
jgi:hypothetical protein